MYKRPSSSLLIFLFLFGGIFVVMPFISSCGKNSATGPPTNTQYQIINVSPGLGSVDLYVNYIKVNTSSYFYPTPSGYFYLNSTTLPFQIRPGTTLVPGSPQATSANYFTLYDTLKPNTRYTLIITGIKPDSTYIFLTDTSSSPSRGRGKIRFVNASPGSTGFDITANDTSLFSNIAYTKYSAFKEVPAGTYEFKMYPTGTATLLRDITNVTIQDGRLYTLYCYGLAGHTSDTLAFSSGFITNK